MDKEVTFERYDPDGFDHMRMPGYEMDIPSEPEVLIERLSALFPEHSDGIRQFVNEVEKTGAGLKILAPPIESEGTTQTSQRGLVYCLEPK